jgi:DNA-binding MarR family transcriptional regulator
MSKTVPFTTTLLVRDTCLCLHSQRAARALARRFDAALRPAGITSGQFSMLMAFNRPEPPALGPVAQLLAMDRTTLTAALKPLQRRGLVRITPDAQDRRNRRVKLTPAGLDLLAEAMPIWGATQTALEAALGKADAHTLRISLETLASLDHAE